MMRMKQETKDLMKDLAVQLRQKEELDIIKDQAKRFKLNWRLGKYEEREIKGILMTFDIAMICIKIGDMQGAKEQVFILDELI